MIPAAIALRTVAARATRSLRLSDPARRRSVRPPRIPLRQRTRARCRWSSGGRFRSHAESIGSAWRLAAGDDARRSARADASSRSQCEPCARGRATTLDPDLTALRSWSTLPRLDFSRCGRHRRARESRLWLVAAPIGSRWRAQPWIGRPADRDEAASGRSASSPTRNRRSSRRGQADRGPRLPTRRAGRRDPRRRPTRSRWSLPDLDELDAPKRRSSERQSASSRGIASRPRARSPELRTRGHRSRSQPRHVELSSDHRADRRHGPSDRTPTAPLAAAADRVRSARRSITTVRLPLRALDLLRPIRINRGTAAAGAPAPAFASPRCAPTGRGWTSPIGAGGTRAQS